MSDPTAVTRQWAESMHNDLRQIRAEQQGTTAAVRDLETTMAKVATKLDMVADLGERVRALELTDARNGNTKDLADRVDAIEKWQSKMIGAAAALGAASGGAAAAIARAVGG